VLGASPSCGEGYRKVRARLARQHGIHAGISEGCAWCDGAGCPAAGSSSGGALAGRDDDPRRTEPALGCGRDDGLDVATTAACGCSVAWTTYPAGAWAHVAKLGDRHAALQPLYDAVIDGWGRWGHVDAASARGLGVRHWLGQPIPVVSLRRLPAGWASSTTPSTSANPSQRLALNDGSEPSQTQCRCAESPRHRRSAPPCRQLLRDRRPPRMAHRASRTANTKRDVPRRHPCRGGIVSTTVQRTGCRRRFTEFGEPTRSRKPAKRQSVACSTDDPDEAASRLARTRNRWRSRRPTPSCAQRRRG